MLKAPLAVLVAALAVSGCADTMLSNERIRNNTAMALGEPASTVTISKRQYDGATNTYYNAQTARGTFHRLINGGGLLAGGMTAPPQCSRL